MMLNALLHPDRSRRWGDRDDETLHGLVAEAHRIAALLDDFNATAEGAAAAGRSGKELTT